jgi:hypothetical protein
MGLLPARTSCSILCLPMATGPNAAPIGTTADRLGDAGVGTIDGFRGFERYRLIGRVEPFMGMALGGPSVYHGPTLRHSHAPTLWPRPETPLGSRAAFKLELWCQQEPVWFSISRARSYDLAPEVDSGRRAKHPTRVSRDQSV